jgi:Cd2+/Zn2+-exporting ATPase
MLIHHSEARLRVQLIASSCILFRLELLAVMEAPSSHPLSACLVTAAKEEGIVASQFSLTEHTILKGEGVTAYVDEERVYVGNERLFKRVDMYDISSQHMESAKQWSDEGGTVGYIGIDGTRGRSIVGIFCVKDTVRDEARDVIASLLRAGIEVAMLTGDSKGAAQAIGKEIGLPNTSIRSQLLPEDKLHYVSAMKGSPANKHPSLSGKKKLILFIGDGVNDAPALAVADVGVAMGDGAALAMEMSDVTLMDSNLSKLLFSMELGAKVITTVKQNIALSMLVNSIAVVLTLFGRMTLLWAIVSDVGVMLLVTLNGMKLLSERTIDAIKEKQIKRPPTRSNGYHRALPSSSFDDDGLELV